MNTINTLNLSESEIRYKVALIDRDTDTNNLIASRLRENGCEVLQAFNSDQIAPLLSQHPDFIIIDPIYDACDEFKLCHYLTNPESAGVVIYSSNPDDIKRREYLFECGILEYFSKDESVAEVSEELLRLFATIRENNLYHITMISHCDATKDKFKKMILHRNYRNCFLTSIAQLYEKWNDHEHEMPDMLILDLYSLENIDEALRLIKHIRIDHLCEMPIMVLLDQLKPHFAAKLYREGANDVLIAPYSSEKLLSKTTRHLDYQISKRLLSYDQHLSTQLKTMINSSAIVSKADPEGFITYVNEQFCEVSGYSYDELIGQPHNIIRHPDNPPLFFKQMWDTLHNKKIFRGIVMNRRKDGSNYYVDSTISPILDDNGTIIEYISIRNDVTPLIKKQHEIEDQRQQIQNVLNSQTSLICLVDKIDGVRQSNQAFLDFLGIENLDPETCGCSFLNELFLDIEGMFRINRDEHSIWLDQLYEKRGTLLKVAIKDRFTNHHVFAIHVEKIPDHHYTDNLCYIVSLENITELNRALREAKAASEAESRFLATMSHEIRTPLNGILGFSELLFETPLNSEQAKYLKAIEYSGETLRQIINDILEVMKLERGELELIPEPFKLIGELEAIIYPFYAQAQKKGVELLTFIDPRLPRSLSADLLRLKQILINLIGNALKFTPSGKKVYVRIKKIKAVNGKVTIGFSVADEGIGVKEENRSAIFNAFSQADNSIARQYGGTGLGLNIVLRVTTAMGGKIRFKSILGKGSVFHTQLEFASEDMAIFPYEYHEMPTHLYLPFDRQSARFNLVERYLKHFGSPKAAVEQTGWLDNLEDSEETRVVLFMDTMSKVELFDTLKRFQKAKLYIIPSFESDISTIPIQNTNVILIHNELSWSTLLKGFNIYHPEGITQSKTEEQESFFGLRFLIAEDNEVNQFYIQEILTKLGIEHDLAHDGYEAVKKFINNKYDLILMDINMPNLDGITATQQILRFEKDVNQPHTPIIGLSADAVAANIAQYLQKGLDSYLIKPLRKSDLIKTLKELFPAQRRCSTALHTLKESEISTQTTSASNNLTADISSKLELPEEVIIKLFDKFISNADVLIRQLEESRNEVQALTTAIHSLKGIAQNLYLEPLSSECERFEADLFVMHDDDKKERIALIIHETRKMMERMDQELRR